MEQTLAERLDNKRFGLVLSAGFFGFYGHAGFVRGLWRAGLRPSAWAGSSAGGLVAAYAAAGLPLERLESLLLEQRRDSFWDPDPIGAVRGVAGGHGATGLLKGDRFVAQLRRTLPASRFEDCLAPLALVAADLSTGEAATFTQGELAPRVHATCAYPGLFRAVSMDGRLYWDGGLVDKAPALALARSSAGVGLEAILVHYLPSRSGGVPSGALAYAQAMEAGMAALRRDHFRLQLEVLAASGLEVHVVVSDLPSVSPRTMTRGRDALEAGAHSATQALERPPRAFAAG